jgi:hypothetical protein
MPEDTLILKKVWRGCYSINRDHPPYNLPPRKGIVNSEECDKHFLINYVKHYGDDISFDRTLGVAHSEEEADKRSYEFAKQIAEATLKDDPSITSLEDRTEHPETAASQTPT